MTKQRRSPIRHNHSYGDGNVTAELHHRDALALLTSRAEGSVDLFLTSPPYFVGKEYDQSKLVDDFESEINRVASAAIRTLRPGGSMCWQVGNHVQDGAIMPLDAIVIACLRKYAGLRLRNRIVWSFGHGVHANQRFSGRHETVLWFTKGDDHFFDLDAVRVPQKYPGKRHYKGPKKGELSGNPNGKNPGDVWDIPNVKAKHVEKTDHPCQFPVALASRLIRSLCPLGGVVLDPYIGSGSTAVAALSSGRNCVGGDLSDRYLTIAQERLVNLQSEVVRIRPDMPVRVPKPLEAVSLVPAHFWGGVGKVAG